jgi:glycosyltransferase involved in cell wall biosynthesis
MKILQFGKFYPPDLGGIESVIYNLTEGLNEFDVDCDVLCSNTSNKYLEEVNNGYRVYRTASYGNFLSTSLSPQLIYKLYKCKNKYDIIHVHLPDPMAMIALLLIKPKCKIVLHWHGDVDFDKYSKMKYLYKILETKVIKLSNQIIFPTTIHLTESHVYNLIEDKANVITYPFNTRDLLSLKIDNDIVEGYKAMDKKIIFSLGRLIYYKGFDYLIEAANDLPNNYLILIGGIGELEDSFKRKIEELNLSSKVHLLGKVPSDLLATYYSLSDIYCFPSISRGEMFGIVQLEAMLFGKPIVATKIKGSGVCEVNIHNETGLCVDIKNSKQLADAMMKICEHDSYYDKLSNNAISRVVDIFGRDKVIPQYIEFYQNLLENE